MRYVFAIVGMIASYFIIKYRESLGNSIGEYEWMSKLGGIYNIVTIAGILIFFWSLAALTGTQDIFLAPILWIMPGFLVPEAPPPPTF